jgi:hypothetical protein
VSNNGIVGQIESIYSHSNADRLDILEVLVSDRFYATPHYVSLITGKHYRVGDFGIWIPDGVEISGWLANDLWLVGKKRRNEPFKVRAMEIRGSMSAGLWVGSWYKKDNSRESAIRASDHYYTGTIIDHEGYIKWPWWNDKWKVGDTVYDLDKWVPSLGSSESEQSVFNREVAGSSPAPSSNEIA